MRAHIRGGATITKAKPVLIYSADDAATAPSLAELYRRHWRELCAYARRTFGVGPPDPEDIAQLAFVRFASLQNEEAVANPRAFLYRTAHNVVMDYRRREAVRDRLAPDLALLDPNEGAANIDAERVLSARQRLAIVERTIRDMEARRRQVLIMHAIHGLNLSEISRRMSLSHTRVTQLFTEAVAQCHKALRNAEGVDVA